MKCACILSALVLMQFISLNSQVEKKTLYTNGRFLYTPCGDKVILRGINKMIIYDSDLDRRKRSYAEIKKTGANCMRIVWQSTPENNEDATVDALDRNIRECIDNDMIPMVELHDATGNWNRLQTLVDYWLSKDVLAIVKKHEKYLLLNIANECGNETITDEQFVSGYESAVMQLRSADIKCPLVIDASDWGKKFYQLRAIGRELIDADPEHNLIFSVHTYWAVEDGADAKFIEDEIKDGVNKNLPFIIGEFTYKFNKESDCIYTTDYKSILKLCQEYEIGWLAWEWGPGNEYFFASCDIMNMTPDSYFINLRDNWAKEVAVTSQYSIANTSVTPEYIIRGGECEPQSNKEQNNLIGQNLIIKPNPFTIKTTISIIVNEEKNATLFIYDTFGQLILRLDNGIYNDGWRIFEINNQQFQYSGIYFCKYKTGNKVYNNKLIYIK